MANKSENRRVNIWINTKDGPNTLKEMQAKAAKLNNELRLMDVNSREYAKGAAELKNVNKKLDHHKAKLRSTGTAWKAIKQEIRQFGMLAIAALGAGVLIAQIESLVKGSARLSDALADVRKTTGLTAEEVETLQQKLKQIDTRTPRKELLELAKVAGKLGITGVENVEAFVRAADKINVALGEDLGDTETVMRELGKITETYNLKEAFGIEQSLLKVGSAINSLGAASTANERYLVDFLKRMGGIAPMAGISIENTLAVAATLDQLGQTSETSSTALAKLFTNMAKETENYAKIAGVSADEFRQMVDKDFMGAFKLLLKGASENSNGMNQLAATLGDLGLDGGRVIGVFGSLAKNLDLLDKQQQIANSSFAEGTSILDEFALKNETFGAKVEKLQKKLAGIFVNSKVVAGLEKMVGWMLKLVNIPLSETWEKERTSLLMLEQKYLDSNTSQADKVKIINELKKQYPDYLGHLDADKTKSNELRAAVQMLNDEMINRIVIQLKQEEIDEKEQKRDDAARAHAKAKIKLYEELGKAQQEMLKAGMKKDELDELLKGTKRIENRAEAFIRKLSFLKLDKDSFLSKSAQDFFNVGDLQKAFDEFRDTRNEYKMHDFGLTDLEKRKAEMEKQLGVFRDNDPFNQKKPKPDPTTPDPVGGTGEGDEEANAASEAYAKLLAEYRQFEQRMADARREFEAAQLSEEEQALAKLRLKYERQQEDYQKAQIALLENTELNEQEKAVLLKQYADLEKEAALQHEAEKAALLDEFKLAREEKEKAEKEEVRMESLSEEEQEIAAITAHYQRLIELAGLYGMEKKALEEGLEAAIAAIRQKYLIKQTDQEEAARQRQLQLANEMSNAYGSLVTGLNNMVAAQGAELGGFEKELALSNILVSQGVALGNVVEAATRPGLTFWEIFPKIIAGMGIVTNTFGSIMSKVEPVQTPSAPKFSTKSSRFFGGDTGNTGIGLKDQYGEFTGYYHENEYLIPSWLRSDPVTMQAERIIEARRQQRLPAGSADAMENKGNQANRTAASASVQQLDIAPLVQEQRLTRMALEQMEGRLHVLFSWEDASQLQMAMEQLEINNADSSL